MDRHDAKPRRPSLMAGAEAQRPAPGQPPARILADLDPTPATRKPRRSKHLRALLVAGMGLLAVAAVGWALVTPSDGDPGLAVPAAPVAVVDVPAEPSGATLMEAPAEANAPVSNPFESGAAAAAPPSPPPAATINPFNAMQATPARSAAHVGATRQAPAGATRTVAAGLTGPATPRGAVPQASKEPGLLQTLMDNIQQPSEPARDTRGMDRLARRLDRAPMPEASVPGAAVVASAAAPARKPAPAAVPAPAAAPTPASTSEKQSLRAMLDRCPASTSMQGQRCRRQMCERAGVDAHRCLRH